MPVLAGPKAARTQDFCVSLEIESDPGATSFGLLCDHLTRPRVAISVAGFFTNHFPEARLRGVKGDRAVDQGRLEVSRLFGPSWVNLNVSPASWPA